MATANDHVLNVAVFPRLFVVSKKVSKVCLRHSHKHRETTSQKHESTKCGQEGCTIHQKKANRNISELRLEESLIFIHDET